MPQIMDDIMDLDGEFEMLTFEVGRMKDDPSHAVMRIFGRDADSPRRAAHGDHRVRRRGGASRRTPTLAPAPTWTASSPTRFYSTTNLETFVRVTASGSVWSTRRWTAASASTAAGTAETVPMSDVKAGDLFVTGHRGIRVLPLERPRESQPFEFMASAVSSEKPKAQIVREVARMLRQVKERGPADDRRRRPGRGAHRRGAAAGPPHRGGLRRRVFGGNAVATHDIESHLYGTSLGVSLKEGTPVPGGHEHHLRAINTIRRCGGIEAAVEQGVLTGGLMYTLVKTARRSCSPAASATTARCPR